MSRGLLLGILLLLLSVHANADEDGPAPKVNEPPWVRHRREAQDLAGGLPKAVLELQRLEPVAVPTIEEASRIALEAARAKAAALVDETWHTGRRLRVPADHPTIQAALDAAAPRDVVVVSAGTYHELLVMKDGVKLVSDAGEDGDELVAVEGARLKLPRRALRTIVDGSKAEPSSQGLIDFQPGTGRHTIVDGFTLQHLPKQNHHRPGHAHAVNVRGASPVIRHCLIQDNGSTGLGNHVVYRDQAAPMPQRDFRVENVEHPAEAIVHGNIVRRNLGRGIGCNHLSAPLLLGNEVCENDDSALGEGSGPGIGMKHGASPTVLGNLVHDNPGGGIVCKGGAPQGAHAIDRPTSPWLIGNVAWRNGSERPCLGAAASGDRERPVIINGNYVFDAGGVGIGVSEAGWATIEGNLVARSAHPGIAVTGVHVLRLDNNKIAQAKEAGITILKGAHVLQMRGNVADAIAGPRFVLRDAQVGDAEPKSGER